MRVRTLSVRAPRCGRHTISHLCQLSVGILRFTDTGSPTSKPAHSPHTSSSHARFPCHQRRRHTHSSDACKRASQSLLAAYPAAHPSWPCPACRAPSDGSFTCPCRSPCVPESARSTTPAPDQSPSLVPTPAGTDCHSDSSADCSSPTTSAVLRGALPITRSASVALPAIPDQWPWHSLARSGLGCTG